MVLVLLSLAWGGLAAFTVNQYASAASSVVSAREPLSVDAQQIYRDLSDANDTAATAFLAGGLEPPAARQRYLADLQAAGTLIESATAQGGATLGGASKDLATLSTDLPIYAGEVETARADNRQGFPLGAAYLREASDLMRSTLLPAADDMYTAENASLTATSAQALIATYPVTPHPIVVTVPQWTDCLVKLQQGQVAAICADASILAGLHAQDPFTKVVGPPFAPQPYGLAISKQHPDFVRFVNAVLAQERADGGWAASYAHWVGTPAPPPPTAKYSG